MKVTDKDYYLDDNLVKVLDTCLKRQTKNFDHVFILDGDEGYGKTTLSFQMAYYVAHQTKKEFKYFFDLEEMLHFASKTEEQVIVWDEAALGALGTDWHSKAQKLLIKMLMVARKKRHFFFFNIPKFYKLQEYISVDRSIGLIHVYSEDHIKRGNFCYYGKRKKQNLYENWKRSRGRGYNKYEFTGKFTAATLVNEEEYDKKKDEAILSIMSEETNASGKQVELWKLKYKFWKFIRNRGIKYEEAGEELGIDASAICKWGKLIDKIPTKRPESEVFG